MILILSQTLQIIQKSMILILSQTLFLVLGDTRAKDLHLGPNYIIFLERGDK